MKHSSLKRLKASTRRPSHTAIIFTQNASDTDWEPSADTKAAALLTGRRGGGSSAAARSGAGQSASRAATAYGGRVASPPRLQQTGNAYRKCRRKSKVAQPTSASPQLRPAYWAPLPFCRSRWALWRKGGGRRTGASSRAAGTSRPYPTAPLGSRDRFRHACGRRRFKGFFWRTRSAGREGARRAGRCSVRPLLPL